MKKLFSLVILTLFCLNLAHAQAILQSVYEIRQSFDFYQYNRSQSGLHNNSLTTDDIEGSPYLSDDFIEGTVYTTSKIQFREIPLRYNAYNDEVEFMKPDSQAYVIDPPEIIESIEFGDHHLEYIPYKVANRTARGFLLVLEKGNASLYSRHRVILEEAKKAAAYQEPTPARFISRADEYYIRIGMEPAVPVNKKKDLNNIFPEDNDKVNAYLKNNKIKLNDPKSLIELVQFYNSL